AYWVAGAESSTPQCGDYTVIACWGVEDSAPATQRLARGEQPHGEISVVGVGLRYNVKHNDPRAQTERRGAAEAGEAFAWRRGLTGRLSLFRRTYRPSSQANRGQ